MKETKERKYFGEMIKYLRRYYGLTQKEFAEKVNLHPSTIASYETNRFLSNKINRDYIYYCFDTSPEILLYKIKEREKSMKKLLSGNLS